MFLAYYQKLIPFLYSEFLGILGLFKFIIFQIIGLFKPVYRQTRQSDMRIVAHKSAALAAQNFMISMAAIGYDTCPMEGSDTLLRQEGFRARTFASSLIDPCSLARQGRT